jgi:cell division protein FtsL
VFILSMNVISIQHKTSNLTKNKEKRMTCQKKNNNKYYFLKNNQQVFDIIVNGPLKFATSN